MIHGIMLYRSQKPLTNYILTVYLDYLVYMVLSHWAWLARLMPYSVSRGGVWPGMPRQTQPRRIW